MAVFRGRDWLDKWEIGTWRRETAIITHVLATCQVTRTTYRSRKAGDSQSRPYMVCPLLQDHSRMVSIYLRKAIETGSLSAKMTD